MVLRLYAVQPEEYNKYPKINIRCILVDGGLK